jgi:hypothetical protein
MCPPIDLHFAVIEGPYSSSARMLAVALNRRMCANMHLVAAIFLSFEKKDEPDESGTMLTF